MGHGGGQEEVQRIINCYDERNAVKEVSGIDGFALLERSNGGKIVRFNPQVIMGAEVVYQYRVESVKREQNDCRNRDEENNVAHVPSDLYFVFPV